MAGTYHLSITASNAYGTAILNYTLVSTVAPPAPMLSIDRSLDFGPEVSWLSDYYAYRLQTSTNFINWQDYVGPIFQVGGTNTTFGITTNQYLFYRLKDGN